MRETARIARERDALVRLHCLQSPLEDELLQASAGRGVLELLESTDPDSPIARFLAKRGEGLHHICFQVDDIAEELRRLRAAGVRLIDEVPRTGADQCLVAFIHPSATGGVLVELAQPVGETDQVDNG